jgi:hypothetical protein
MLGAQCDAVHTNKSLQIQQVAYQCSKSNQQSQILQTAARRRQRSNPPSENRYLAHNTSHTTGSIQLLDSGPFSEHHNHQITCGSAEHTRLNKLLLGYAASAFWATRIEFPKASIYTHIAELQCPTCKPQWRRRRCNTLHKQPATHANAELAKNEASSNLTRRRSCINADTLPLVNIGVPCPQPQRQSTSLSSANGVRIFCCICHACQV